MSAEKGWVQKNTLPGNPPHFTPADWKIAYEEEFKRRQQSESDLALARKRVAALGSKAIEAQKMMDKAATRRWRTADIRVHTARQMLAAMLNGVEEITEADIERLVDRSISIADHLLSVLEATRTPKENH